MGDLRVRMCALSLVAGMMAVLAVPSASGAAPEQDSVVGFLTESNPPFSVRVDVRGGPSGEAPSGTFTFDFFTFSQSERFQSTSITCLAVSGSVAVVGGFGQLRLSGAGPTGPISETRTTGFVVVIRDNGETPPPPDGQPFPNSTIDDFGHRYVEEPDCAAPGFEPSGFNVIGEFVVVDAPALPSTKEQCKGEGWRAYGDAFKNQGQCVAFVQRGPKRGAG